MNKAKLKTYAPQARKDFIAAVTARAHRLGLSEANGQLVIAPAQMSGDLVMIAGQSWPAKVGQQRDKLIALIQQEGFQHTMEAVAYTWFNRFAAIRYMEIHDFLKHGYRVLSNREGGLPEILTHALELAQNGQLPSLNAQKVTELKLAGDQDGELYRLTLIAQCNVLANAIPFLFERIDDETELLLPDNLLRTDSVIAKLVSAIPEQDWQEVEIIGWLYQFYISEKKDQVIGNVVKSEDIPAATQLFTPNWIVKYLVQNSVGRLWMMANPASVLKGQWQYYIEPAEQTPEVQAQLDALIQTRMSEDSPLSEGEGSGEKGLLNPETISFLDPACGSGHILVEAYEVLKAIYLERGYQPRSIPRLILEKNLYGLDIDDRAAQLAGFALLMKARADDRRLLDNPPKLNVLALQESKGLDADELIQALVPFVGWADAGSPTLPTKTLGFVNSAQPTPVEAQLIRQLLDTFAHALTFGSLIQIPPELNARLPALEDALQQALQSGDLFTQAAAFDLLPLVQQARILGMQFDAVVANPPYMGGKGMNAKLKDFAKRTFPDSKSDLFAMFIERGFGWCKSSGFNSMVTMQSWMFLSSYEGLREKLVTNRTLNTMAHLGARAFAEISGEVVQTTAFVFHQQIMNGYKPAFFRLIDGNEEQKAAALRSNQNRFDATVQDDFKKISGSPIAYWVSDKIRNAFSQNLTLNDISDVRSGLTSGDKPKFVKIWNEVSERDINFFARHDHLNEKKWFPHNDGGNARKWFGNRYSVIDWFNNGENIKNQVNSTIRNPSYFFKEGITWTDVSSSFFCARMVNTGFVFENTGSMVFVKDDKQIFSLLAFMCSKVAFYLMNIMNPTLHFGVGEVSKLPFKVVDIESIEKLKKCVSIARTDWDSYETSWDFAANPLIATKQKTLALAYLEWETQNRAAHAEMKRLEEENNRLFIEAYGLQDELSPEIPDEQITLNHADQEKDCQRLISFAIGCMMGRYSLDEPSLIYAHAGNTGFDADRYQTFPADADGIVPITDELWFDDDATNRLLEFLLTVWDATTLDENIAWLAESLGQKANETSMETIRRYISANFFKDHLQTYKKRPIYWLFSSGKQGAFQALVYLHRYHEGTLSRMRTEYVVPLMGKLQSRLDMLDKDALAATSNATRNKLNKDVEKLRKKHVELLAYDEKLRHFADQRIKLDLDDGVKVNYGKFGDLLAEVKAVTGGASDD